MKAPVVVVAVVTVVATLFVVWLLWWTVAIVSWMECGVADPLGMAQAEGVANEASCLVALLEGK